MAESTEIPDDVIKVLGSKAVHCDACGGWHHVDYHKPWPCQQIDRAGSGGGRR